MLSAAPATANEVRANADPSVRLHTSDGDIDILLDLRAPLTTANFLRYVDLRLYDGSSFYRVVTPANDHHPGSKIAVIQGGIGKEVATLPPVPHESTGETGLRHEGGTIFMARNGPGTAGSEFCIDLRPNVSLDFGGDRKPDGLGFAVFGRVVRGMAVVRRIYRRPTTGVTEQPAYVGQILEKPVRIISVSRID
jgi:peptidyl-prolyl cis-trans isomerase A (cyclophilin A)